MAETKTSPTLNSYFTLTVQVLDSNDNAPEFQSDPYDIMVSEALAKGTDVVQVQALDPDFGANGEIRYLQNLITYMYWSYSTIVYLVKMESFSNFDMFLDTIWSNLTHCLRLTPIQAGLKCSTN